MTVNIPPGALESAGITAGSGWLATPEESAEIDRREAERIAKGNAVIDATLAACWRCQATPTCSCDSCRQARYVLEGLRLLEETVNGRTRRQWLETRTP
jgi:hypothetical protein